MKIEKTVAFYTLGCKLNFTETSTIGREFVDAGYKKVNFEDSPDVYVINTCSVTDSANKKCRNIVNRARRHAPNAFIAVTGCYAQLKPGEIAEIPGVDIVLGASEKYNMLEHVRLKEQGSEQKVYSCEIEHVNEFKASYSHGDRTRSFLKVQDGCDYSCTFCTIPLARGKSRSQSIEKTIASAKEVAAKGVKEVVLSGVNIGDFGKNHTAKAGDPRENFLGLIQALDQIEGIERFRISSIEPNLLSDEIIDFVAHSRRFMPHFHIPLQSGSNTILKLMRRRYLREVYSARVARIKSLMPQAAIGVDVIVGFPGESDEAFAETYDYLNQLDISYLHVFTYSERENTPAANMEASVPPNVRKERSKMLHILSDKKRRAFYRQFEGAPGNVLFESPNADGSIYGFTDNYVKVTTNYVEGLENNIVELKLNSVNSDGIMTADGDSISAAGKIRHQETSF
ncbi:MAG: tRNA (N(6)-L-threonylcarbamoyladenosine(37)-C(2))-methylthiotransferase MtaB [Flavobacteriales bacterium]|nr:tRNA (N(6)-L-threonylcarbamoyladenosine(37)-C(2))-methylthiotransferase MtaB [Flavobacteriales bacterium]